MANTGGTRREDWREDDREDQASRRDQSEQEPFDSEGQAPGEPRSSAGPRLVSRSNASNNLSSEQGPAKLGVDYTRPPFREGGTRGGGSEYGEPNPERNFPHAYNSDELQNTDLNPMMEVPSNPGTTLSVLVLFAGALIMLVLIALLFFQFATPAPRSP